MEPVYYTEFKTALQKMLIAGNSKGLLKVAFRMKEAVNQEKQQWIKTQSLFGKEIMAIQNYLQGKGNVLEQLDWKMGKVGTSFQRRVWKALRKIPYGETATYGEIAAEVGCPGGARAVGGACNANPFVLIVPCHRVIGSGRNLTGFGCGLELKSHLLKLENFRVEFTTG